MAPLTGRRRGRPHRLAVRFQGVEGEVATDQIRTVDQTRLVQRLGALGEPDARALGDRLVAIFAFDD